MSTKIKVRRDLKQNWESYNPVLDDGELGWVKDEKKLKIGDGTSHFNDLDPVISKSEYEPVYIPFERVQNDSYFKIDGLLSKSNSVPYSNRDITVFAFEYVITPSNYIDYEEMNLSLLGKTSNGTTGSFYTSIKIFNSMPREDSGDVNDPYNVIEPTYYENDNERIYRLFNWNGYGGRNRDSALTGGRHYFEVHVNSEGKIVAIYTKFSVCFYFRCSLSDGAFVTNVDARYYYTDNSHAEFSDIILLQENFVNCDDAGAIVIKQPLYRLNLNAPTVY